MFRLLVILATVFAFSNVTFANDAHDAHKKPATATEAVKDAAADKEGAKKEMEEEVKEGKEVVKKDATKK